jgi:RIO kinase 1
MFDELIEFISRMYNKAKLVHADLSVYNVLLFNSKAYIIDVGQGVLLEHPSSIDFLKRDIHNIVKYFSRYGIKEDEKKIFQHIIKK